MSYGCSSGGVGVAPLERTCRIYGDLAPPAWSELPGSMIQRWKRPKVAEKHRSQGVGWLEEAAAGSDALSVVTPTVTHFKLAQALLDQGKHVLVEKPMTNSASQAAELVELAQRRHCVLQVGHVERFNPVFKYLEGVATQPRFIEAHRLSPFQRAARTSAWCSI